MEHGLHESGKFEIPSPSGVTIQDTGSDSFSAETEGKEERMGAKANVYRWWRRKLREFSPDGLMSIL